MIIELMMHFIDQYNVEVYHVYATDKNSTTKNDHDLYDINKYNTFNTAKNTACNILQQDTNNIYHSLHKFNENT